MSMLGGNGGERVEQKTCVDCCDLFVVSGISSSMAKEGKTRTGTPITCTAPLPRELKRKNALERGRVNGVTGCVWSPINGISIQCRLRKLRGERGYPSPSLRMQMRWELRPPLAHSARTWYIHGVRTGDVHRKKMESLSTSFWQEGG